jgi:hypothetical protein
LTGVLAREQYINKIKRDWRVLAGGLSPASITITQGLPVATKAAGILLCCTMIVTGDWIVRKNQSISA